MFIIVFQTTQGSLFWVYTAEVCTDKANSVVLFVLQSTLIMLTSCTPSLISQNNYGVPGLILTLSIFQVVPLVVLGLCMKETRGLSFEEKRNLYKPKQI